MAKRALLIGINKYLIPGADLRGCVNDVKNLSAALTGLFGFKKSEITQLIDTAATKKAIEAALKKLVREAKAGDTVLVHYSGHGSNVPDDNGDEADARDEILCPTDLDWKDPLRDDWLRVTFDKFKAGVKLTVIMDCCHSGTNTRAISPPDAPIKERYLPSPWDLVATESRRRLRGKFTTGLHASSRSARAAQDIVNADLPEVLITGCRDTQTSADAFLEGAYTGALTWALVEAMKKQKGKLSYRELHAVASAALRKKNFDQVPQLEGKSTRFDEPMLA